MPRRPLAVAASVLLTIVTGYAFGQTPPPAAPGTPAPATQPAPEKPLSQEIDREEPAPRTAPAPTAAHAHHPGACDRCEPVVRAQAGNLGLFFRFGGLATLEATNNSRVVNTGLVMTQVGLKLVLSERWMLPLTFGTAFRRTEGPNVGVIPPERTSAVDAGLDIGFGFEHHFRIWRRISPFVGASFGFSYVNPTGDENALYGLGFGPSLGIEYYVLDRVSLTAQYLFVFQFALQDEPSVPGVDLDMSTSSFAFQTLAGGAMNLTYYF